MQLCRGFKIVFSYLQFNKFHLIFITIQTLVFPFLYFPIFLRQTQTYPVNLCPASAFATCHLTGGPCKLCGSLLNVYVPRCQPFYGQKKRQKVLSCRQTGAQWAIFICRILFMQQQLQPSSEKCHKKTVWQLFFFLFGNCFTNIFGNFQEGLPLIAHLI